MIDPSEQTLFVVDDDDAVRDSIRELADSVGLRVECYASPRAFLAVFRADRPGCLVLDVRMAEMSGLALQELLVSKGFRIPTIILTGHADVPMAVQAMKVGAVDFLQKPYREQALLDSVNAAMALDRKARAATSGDQFQSRLETLTERERQVLNQLLAGKTSKEIARHFAISPRTAEAHRRSLLHKLGVSSARELLVVAARLQPGG